MINKSPEKIYFTSTRRAIEYIKWAGLDKKEPSDDIEYIRKDIHLKIKNDWFAKGLKAGKISKNTSGCCCVIEDDGETISSLCGAHKALHDKKAEDFKQLAETYRRILNAKGTKAEEV